MGKKVIEDTGFIYITPNTRKGEQYRFRDRNIYDKTMVKKQENYDKNPWYTYLFLRKHRW